MRRSGDPAAWGGPAKRRKGLMRSRSLPLRAFCDGKARMKKVKSCEVVYEKEAREVTLLLGWRAESHVKSLGCLKIRVKIYHKDIESKA